MATEFERTAEEKEVLLRDVIHKAVDELPQKQAEQFKSYLIWLLNSRDNSLLPPAYQQEESL